MEKIRAGIIGSVCIKPFKDYRFLTCSELNFYFNDQKFIVPEGFETDLASIPRLFWSIVPPYNTSLIAPAIVHDWLYSRHTKIKRLECDKIFYFLLVKNGMSKFLAGIMYFCVRIFGSSHFKE